jgi:hypothetical protein
MAAAEASDMDHKSSIIVADASKPTGQEGVIGWGILWLLGIPLPILLIAWLLLR